ncbi:MATE family efflux transporter [candidate division KSB1 bacterium]|nr:MATE family efflux transporter [candidate division KSB1 bacterium]
MLRTLPPPKVAEIIHGPAAHGTHRPFARELKQQIRKEVLSMGLPSLTGFLVISFNELVSMFWLGRIGTAPVAAVTMSATLIWLCSFANVVIGAGSVAAISRRFGEQDMGRTELAIKATFYLKFAAGTLFGLLGILVMDWGFTFLGAAPDVHALSLEYSVVQFVTMGFAMTSFSVYTALRSIGKPREAMVLQALGTGFNLVLDPLLIFGVGPFPELGVLGASIATSGSYIVVVVAGCALLAGPRSPVRVRWFSRSLPKWSEMWPVIRIGAPAGLNQLSFALAMSFAVKLIAHHGTDVVAIYGMGQKAIHFGVMMVVGLGLGTGALIGQFLGSRALDKAWVAGVLSTRLAFWMMVGYGSLIFVGAPFIVHFFFKDVTLYPLATNLLRIMALSLPLIGIHIGAETAFEGAGQNTPPMILSIIHSWVMVIPFMWLLGNFLGFGPYGLLWGWTASHAAGGAAALWLFRRGTWLKHEV